MPRIPRPASRTCAAQPMAGRGRLRRSLGVLVTAAGALLWLGEAAHHMAAS